MQVALHIESTLSQQEKDLSEIQNLMKELSEETVTLRTAIGDASRSS